MFVVFTKYQNDETKKDEMGETCSTFVGDKKGVTNFCWKAQREGPSQESLA